MTPSSPITLSWFDYTIFAGTLVFSTLIGIYYGCFGSKQGTTREYLMGGKTMKIIPIGISVAVRWVRHKIFNRHDLENFSHIAGAVLVGTAADVFRYGASIWLCVVSVIVMGLLTNFVYLPVFFKLRLRNVYDYLEKRFDKKTRMLAIIFYTIGEILLFPVHAYSPSLTFATGKESVRFFI